MPHPPHTTITATMRTGLDPPKLLRLLCLASPAYPTGSFAYSHGLEAAVASGAVIDEKSLRAWLDNVLRYGSGRSDTILLRHAHRASENPTAQRDLATLAEAASLGAERKAETLDQGAAFARAAGVWETMDTAAYPVAFGTLTARQSIDEESACLAYLFSWLSNLVSAAMRLGLIGQAAGLRILTSLESAVMDIEYETRHAPVDDIGGACFLADIASMQHETQYSRVFRS